MSFQYPPPWTAKYIGIPFKDKGCSFEGVNCWGLVYLVYKEECGVVLPRYSEEYRHSFCDEIEALIQKERKEHWRLVDSPQLFDCVQLKIAGEEKHVAIFAGNGWMIHALRGCESSAERMNSLEWKNKIVGVYRCQKI